MIQNYQLIMNEIWIPKKSLTFTLTLGGTDDQSYLLCTPQARYATVIQVMLDYEHYYSEKAQSV